jgi:hypothetical protein
MDTKRCVSFVAKKILADPWDRAKSPTTDEYNRKSFCDRPSARQPSRQPSMMYLDSELEMLISFTAAFTVTIVD